MFADQLVTDELLKMVGIQDTCILCSGHYHLFHSVFQQFFGEQLWANHLQPIPRGMLTHGKETDWKIFFELATTSVQTSNTHFEYIERI